MNPGKAKRIRTLDEEGFSKLVWDSNRVWSSASRRLHGTGQEMMGQNLCIVPRIAQELVPGVAVEDLQGTLDDMKRAWDGPATNAPLGAQRPDGAGNRAEMEDMVGGGMAQAGLHP